MIKIKNVSYKYDTHCEKSSLNNISLNIKKGEFIVLCGRSGCGKSTISRLINGLIPHFYEGQLSGEVFVDGLNTKMSSLSQISKLVGSVFQNPKSQFFNTDTTSELAFGCENQGLPRDETLSRIERSVANFELQNLLGRDIFMLSGGEKQRIACGSVYATNPDIFVLDEPSSNLDAKSIQKLKEILKRLKEEGKTIIVSEHRFYFLTELADRFIYIQNGEIDREFSNKDFNSLTLEALNSLGLRTTKPHLLKSTGTTKNISDDIAVHIKNLSYAYKNNDALSVSDLTFNANSIIAIIGENGAGKSTFINSLCGIFKAKGEVFIASKKCSLKERIKKSFMVMQDVNFQLFCDSVDSEVKLNLSEDEARQVPNLLKRLDLAHTTDSHPVSLSGGEKQRVAICCALATNKDILFFDEPTSGLDFSGMMEFSKLVSEYSKNVLLSLIVTHDIELILSCATHILHLENGSVIDFYALDEVGESKIKAFNNL